MWRHKLTNFTLNQTKFTSSNSFVFRILTVSDWFCSRIEWKKIRRFKKTAQSRGTSFEDTYGHTYAFVGTHILRQHSLIYWTMKRRKNGERERKSEKVCCFKNETHFIIGFVDLFRSHKPFFKSNVIAYTLIMFLISTTYRIEHRYDCVHVCVSQILDEIYTLARTIYVKMCSIHFFHSFSCSRQFCWRMRKKIYV